jgi:tRNA pseudouridine38-40 synthase
MRSWRQRRGSIIRPDGEAAVDAMLRRARLTVAYDGTSFHGFAENDGVRTVMGDLREAIEKIVQQPVDLVGAGRTDAGVHGWGQVVSCDLPDEIDLQAVLRRVNRMCGPAVVVRDIEWAGSIEFSARFSGKWRHYRYDIWNAPEPNVFLAATSWYVYQPLSLPALRLACDPLIGEHDFSAFCRRPRAVPDQREPSMSRNVMLARWSQVPTDYGDGLLRFEIRANAFCHQMVRAIVGTMVDAGAGRLAAGEMRGILLGKDRQAAGQVAPPHGLCLWEVGYD